VLSRRTHWVRGDLPPLTNGRYVKWEDLRTALDATRPSDGGETDAARAFVQRMSRVLEGLELPAEPAAAAALMKVRRFCRDLDEVLAREQRRG
jgi:hypothetical protein